NADELAVLELLEHSRDRLARGADRVGDLLVRWPADDEVTVDGRLPRFVRQPQEVAREAAADAEERERLDHVVGTAQARGQGLQDLPGQREVVLQQGEEVRPRDHDQLRIRQRGDRGAPRLALEQGHLPEEVAGLQVRQHTSRPSEESTYTLTSPRTRTKN